jgi:hypothetical protein
LIIDHQFVILPSGPQSRELLIEKPRALVSGPTLQNNKPAPAIGKTSEDGTRPSPLGRAKQRGSKI